MARAKTPHKGQHNAKARAKAQARGGFGAGGFYRLCRMLHGYLSAFAFLALIFFSVTGLTLNHPDWLAGRRPSERVVMVKLPKSEVDAALKTADPGRTLAAALGRVTPLKGRYASGEVVDGEALLRFEGPSGVSDVVLRTATGEAEIGVRSASAISVLNDLHKGKAAGKAWSWVIDLSAIAFIVLSALGYVLFFSLRFRLPLSLVLTGVSLVLMLGMFWLFVA
jgi:hypothetical protein